MTSTRARTAGSGPRPSLGSRLAFLRSPGWLGAIAAALAFSAVCFWILAPWQFHRHVERDLRNSTISTVAGAAPVPLEQRLTPTNGVAADEVWQPVSATGVFLSDQQVAVRLRQNENTGAPASEILTPLRLTDGSVVLVDRGYVSIESMAGGAAPPAAPGGSVTVVGRLQPFQPDPSHRAPVRVGNRLEVYGISATSIGELPGPVLGGFIQLVPDTPGVLTPISVPQMDPGPYFSYAWQWLAFGTMSILAIGFFVFREFTDPREPEPSGESAGSGTDQPTGGDDDSDDDGRDDDGGGDTAHAGAVNPAKQVPPAPRAPKRRKGFDRSSLYDPS